MKKFIIVGNMNAVDYKEIFPLIRDNQMWLGASKGIGWKSLFLVPDNYEGNNVVVIDGKKYAQNNTAAWFTNVEHKKRNTPIDLCKRYSNDYKHYDNYDAIEVGKISYIPKDYEGVMGVPITYLDKWDPDKYELLDMKSDCDLNGKRLFKRLFIRKK